jgi:glycine/D-amino acid oxidase-like deaminating enzyme
MLLNLRTLPEDGTGHFDVVVVGAGGAGMTAALVAAIAGARVLLVERTEFVGGSTAYSAGTTWVPGTSHGARVNPADTLAEAARYLDAAIGDRAPRALREAFLAHGAQAVAHLEANSEVRYRACALHPDYLSELAGSTVNGRALEPLPFDGRRLGALFALLRPPIPEFTVFGGMMVDRTDIKHLLGLTRSFESFRHALKILVRHASDRLRHPRGTRLVMGNALVARLLYSLAQRPNVGLAMNTSVESIRRGASGVDALTLVQQGQRRSVSVTGGVILASGGFNRHPELRSQLLPGVPVDCCPGAPGHTGTAQDLARKLGAHFGTGGMTHAFWAPVSRRQRSDGSLAVFPHFVMDRAKPGFITVDALGRRFVNESTSYHLFGLAMQTPGAAATPAFLICDAAALRRYGIGMVRPGGKGLEPFIADGYLTRGATLAELAQRLGIPAPALEASVARMNRFAETGDDSDFQRGVTAYERNLGDPAWPGPNPNLGELGDAPFYAVRLYPGDIGAATGLVTDAAARVQGQGDAVIPGLYAVGNDMHSVMGGVYTGPGITIGPGLVFASLAARDAAQRAAHPAHTSERQAA